MPRRNSCTSLSGRVYTVLHVNSVVCWPGALAPGYPHYEYDVPGFVRVKDRYVLYTATGKAVPLEKAGFPFARLPRVPDEVQLS